MSDGSPSWPPSGNAGCAAALRGLAGASDADLAAVAFAPARFLTAG